MSLFVTLSGALVAQKRFVVLVGRCAPVNLEKAIIHFCLYAFRFPDIFAKRGANIYFVRRGNIRVGESQSGDQVADVIGEFEINFLRGK